MQPITLNLPEELSRALTSGGEELPRAALEALSVEAYREGKISHGQLARLLGCQTPMELDALLKRRGVDLEYTAADLERDRATLSRLD